MKQRPNIVLILADDMGYSDIGCFGGEIDTPNIDALSRGGQAYTQFYNTARCCPTRASLLTGLHPHQTGIGHMTHTPEDKAAYDKGLFGYRGFLNRSCITLPEILKEAGYHTYMSGKWHLGMWEENQWPRQRGFDRFYGILPGVCNYMRPTAPRGLYLENAPAEPGDNFYSTNAFTDYALQFLREQQDDRPFFLYMAYNAPHWPLQAPREYVQKYRGRYLCGWDEIREKRYARMLEKEIITAQSCALPPRDPEVRPWDALDDAKKDEMDLRMATYAAQIDCMDHSIGRLTQYLREKGQLDNTLILFLSDNGGCAEGGELGHGAMEEINSPDIVNLMVSYGRCWANASNTPFRMYKRYVHEGGMATPLIAHWPDGITAGGLTHAPGYLPDIMPTFLELAGIAYPGSYQGNSLPAPEGKSLVPIFETGEREGHTRMCWEHEDNCSIRCGRYKALQKFDTGEWELYDLETDRSELHNLADTHPGIVKSLAGQWYEWAKSHHVMPKA